MNTKKITANLIKHYRKLASLTQQALAQKSTINLRHYQEIEGEKSDVRLTSLNKVAKQLHVPVCYLIQDSFDGDLAKISMGCKSEILDMIPVGIEISDLEGNLLYLNKYHHFHLGNASAQNRPKKAWDMVYDENAKKGVQDYIKYLIAEMPPPTPYHVVNRGPSGERIEVVAYWDYLKNGSGKLIGFAVAVIETARIYPKDVTETDAASLSQPAL